MGGLTAGYAIAGKYRLVAPLGRGAMGEVWRAEHALLKSALAIKVLHPQHLTGNEGDVRGLMERFFREARATAALRSPHVVQILDFGQDGAVPFIAMELLEGETLEQRIEKTRTLSPRETSAVITQVARAMEKAHEASIVHRDLKPANVFLVRSFEGELVKVLDFGIAKVASGPTGSRATQIGATVGTPAYMSPEQVQASRALDHRADLWSLAVIAFECLTGQLPFEGDSFGALVLAICVHPPPRPSAKGAVPPGFDAWFTKAVSRNPDERFQSAKDLADSLRAVLCPDERGSQGSLSAVDPDLRFMAWAPTLLSPPSGSDSLAISTSGAMPVPGGGGAGPAWAAPAGGAAIQVAPAHVAPAQIAPAQVAPAQVASAHVAPAQGAAPRALAAPGPGVAPALETSPPQRPWMVIAGAVAGAAVVLMITALAGYWRSRPPEEPAQVPIPAAAPGGDITLTADPVGTRDAPAAPGAHAAPAESARP